MMKRHLMNWNRLVIIFLILSVTKGCHDIAVPRPKGYFRIDLPEKEYTIFHDTVVNNSYLPLRFEYPVYGDISFEKDEYSEPGWFNINFPAYQAKIYLTYRDIDNDLEDLMEQTYTMNVKNHITKADAIKEKMFIDEGNKVYGILYDLKGNTATAVQFFVTDSVKHFFRGSLYFFAQPNPDSLAPLNEFFREDIVHLIETLRWEEK